MSLTKPIIITLLLGNSNTYLSLAFVCLSCRMNYLSWYLFLLLFLSVMSIRRFFFLFWSSRSLLDDDIVLDVKLIMHIHDVYLNTWIWITAVFMLTSSCRMTLVRLLAHIILIWRNDPLNVEKLLRSVTYIVLHILHAIRVAY